MATAACEVKPTADEAATIARPALEPGEKDYSHHHDPLYCAVEINVALMRDKISKVGHLTKIIEAHFPNVAEMYKAHADLLAATKALVECCKMQHAFQNPNNQFTRDRLLEVQRAIKRAEA